MTKTEARQIAARARRYGYSDLGAGQIQVTCPRCRQRVTTRRNYRYRPARKGEPGSIDPLVIGGRRAVFERESVTQALDRAMVDHLAAPGNGGDHPATSPNISQSPANT